MATIRVVLEPTAEAELQEAIRWYDQKQSGLRAELGLEVDRCIERIRANPEMYARVKKDFRRARVQRFPYSIFYEFVSNTMIVYAVFHASRNPAQLQRRLR